MQFCSKRPPRGGALNGLMAELIDGHIRHHVLNDTGREKATDESMEIVRT
jgi:DNA-binding FrmR family transcriptional regulator